MYKKIFQILCVIGFFLVFGYLHGEEYWNYRDVKKSEQNYQQQLQKKNVHFDISDIQELSGDIQLHYTPYLRLLDDIVKDIDTAKERVFLEAYIFTESKMRDAIIRAHKRGVDVKVLLENNPYKAPYLNDKTFAFLKESGVNVKWSDPLNYSLNHSKMLIVDDYLYISTGNFSYSLFKHNRDFILQLSDRDIVKVLTHLFQNDFQHKKQGVVHENIVLSPDNSRNKMTRLLQSAEKNIDFYFPYIADVDFQKELFSLVEKGVSIRGIVEEKFYKENRDLIQKFEKQGIEIRYLDRKKLHGKVILVDKKIMYLGSVNFSTFSFDENREIGILVRNPVIISKISDLFESDF